MKSAKRVLEQAQISRISKNFNQQSGDDQPLSALITFQIKLRKMLITFLSILMTEITPEIGCKGTRTLKPFFENLLSKVGSKATERKVFALFSNLQVPVQKKDRYDQFITSLHEAYPLVDISEEQLNELSPAVDFLARWYEGTACAGADSTSQSGTMKSLPFFKMLKATNDGGIQSTTWIDGGCGAGIILSLVMVYNSVMKGPVQHFLGFDMIESQTLKARKLLTTCKQLLHLGGDVNIVTAKITEEIHIINSLMYQNDDDKWGPSRCYFSNNWSWNRNSDEKFKEEFLLKHLKLESPTHNVQVFSRPQHSHRSISTHVSV